MDRDEVWREINEHRTRVVALLEDLSPDEWTAQSLCGSWTVRDVAGHLAWQNNAGFVSGIGAMIKARGDMNRVIRDQSIAYARHPIPRLVDDIRNLIGTRKKPLVVTHLEQLIDVLVHSQDIAIPLGRDLPLPVEAAGVAATRVLTTGFPWYANKKFADFRLVATDTDWAFGDGIEVQGPMDALLLVVTDRLVALPRLHGEGAGKLTAQLA